MLARYATGLGKHPKEWFTTVFTHPRGEKMASRVLNSYLCHFLAHGLGQTLKFL